MINEIELPKNWEVVKLGEAARFIDYRGRTPKKTESGIPLITAKNVKKGFISETPREFIAERDYESWMTRGIPNKGDVLFTTEAPLGNVAQLKTGKKIALAQRIITFQPFSKLNNSFLNYCLQSPQFQKVLNEKGTGTTVKGIKAAILKQLEVVLPPLAEQERIVAKIEELLSELDAGLESLKTAQAQLKTYRQAVLKYAFEGKLTNDNVNEGELPNGWKWEKLGDTIIKIEAGKSFKCDERPPKENEIGVVKVSAVSWGEFDEDESKTILSYDQFRENYLIRQNDFLFSRANTIELVGACVIVKNVNKNLMLSDKTLRLIFNENIKKEFALYYLRSRLGRKEIESLSTGNQDSMRNIGQERIKQIQIPLCSIVEQQHIVEEIESRLSVCDKLEETINASLKQAEALRQSILKQAFEGKLI